jgi:hypothetical protein
MQIMSEDVSHLFNKALDWFKGSPDEQIPLELWRKGFGSASSRLSISDGVTIVDNVSSAIIPVLAAISLGATTEQLSEIMLHHQVTATDLARCNYLSALKLYTGQPKSNLTPWSVARRMVEAFCSKPVLTKEFLSDYPLTSKSPEHQIAVLLSDQPDLWPVTKARKFIGDIDAGRLQAGFIYDFLELSTLEMAQIDFNYLTNKEILLILDRSGQFCLEATVEYGFTNEFFLELLKKPNAEGTVARNRILEAINSVEDSTLIKQIIHRIAECLPTVWNGGIGGAQLLAEVRQNLDQAKYGELTTSMVLKLAVLTQPGLRGLVITSHELLNEPCFDALVSRPQSVLSQLHAELISVDVKAFRTLHFKSICNAFWEGMPDQDISIPSLQELFTHTLKAFELYRERLDNPSSGFIKSVYSSAAQDQLRPLMQYAACRIDTDYEWLSSLPSPTKAFLAGNGFELKKINGINNKDRGKLLEDQLGM